MSDDISLLMTGGIIPADEYGLGLLDASGVEITLLQGNGIDAATAVEAARANNLAPAPMSLEGRVEVMEQALAIAHNQIRVLQEKLDKFFTIHLGGRLG
jgi:hypothetical protein